MMQDNQSSAETDLYLDSRFQQLVQLTSQLLIQLIQSQGQPCKSIFNSSSIPSISLDNFLKRLHRYTQFSPECLIIAIIYIDKYNMSQPEFRLNHLNVHKLILTSILLATKFQDDFYYDNKAFQFAGGVNAAHLHILQLELFQKLEYNLFIDKQTYENLQHKLYEAYSSQQHN